MAHQCHIINNQTNSNKYEEEEKTNIIRFVIDANAINLLICHKFRSVSENKKEIQCTRGYRIHFVRCTYVNRTLNVIVKKTAESEPISLKCDAGLSN